MMNSRSWLLMLVLCAASNFRGLATDSPPALPAPPPLPPTDTAPPGNLVPQIFPEVRRDAPAPAARPTPPPQPAFPANTDLPLMVIAWDSLSKEVALKPGEIEAKYVFNLTNVCATNVIINSAAASCGCTVAKLPANPWTLAPGTNGDIHVTMNVAGKSGVVIKTVTINSTAGTKLLTVRAIVPPPQVAPATPMSPLDRERNQQLAKADRMAVFKGDCARCHIEPARGKLGKDLFASACGVCHLAEHRASMVPDLKKVNSEGGAEYWLNWITKGKAGSLMPAWAQSEGGRLTPDEIETVVQYLMAEFTPPQPILPPAPR
jgi:mono/diheme cytochrome c family protein